MPVERTLVLADQVKPKFHVKSFRNTDNPYPVSVRLYNLDKTKSLVVNGGFI